MTESTAAPIPLTAPRVNGGMGDDVTTLAELRAVVETFVAERQWEKFHNPKNLSMSLAVEAAELMEHFQWLTLEEADSQRLTPEQKQAIGEEMSDVFCYLMALSNGLGIDLSSAFAAKMVKNRQKYPATEFQGVYRRVSQ